MHDLASLGFGPVFVAQYQLLERPDLVPARIASESRGIYHLRGCRASLAEASGRLRHELHPLERPSAGDWVAVADDGHRAIIHHVFDRRTQLVRRAVASGGEAQVVAANVDVAFIVTSANRDFNLRRIERYLTAVWDSGASPVIVLNKVDLGGVGPEMLDALDKVAMGAPVLQTSALMGIGRDELRAFVGPGRTLALVGSSGVGKSSLSNLLLGQELLDTGGIRADDDRGRHTTTRRELVELPGGGMLLDTPGMREFGLIVDEDSLDSAFADVQELAAQCRFGDCQHRGEPGCAVGAAIETGDLEPSRLRSYDKLQRELAALARRGDPRLQAEARKKWRAVSKSYRERTRNNPKVPR